MLRNVASITGGFREAENAEILALSKRGIAIKEIMGRTDKSRGLVRQVVQGERTDIFRGRMSSVDPFLTQLETAWTDGRHNGAALWRAMKVKDSPAASASSLNERRGSGRTKEMHLSREGGGNGGTGTYIACP